MAAVILAKSAIGGVLYGSIIGAAFGSGILRNDLKKSVIVGIALTAIALAVGHLFGPVAFHLAAFSLFAMTIAYDMQAFEDTRFQTLFLQRVGL